jgi:predicted porin
MAAPAAMADAPTVYGKFNVNINTVTDGGNGVNDTASRIGIKGSEDLGNGLKAIYKAEFSLDIEGNGGLGERNQYLGLAGGFGTVLIGQHDSPLKMAQPTDLFNDGAADNSRLGMGVGGKTGEIRATEVLAYVSPSFGGVKLIAAGTSPATSPDADDRSITGGTHAAITYGSTKKGLFLSAAMDDFSEDGYGLADNYTQTSFAAQYKTGGLTVNGMIREFDDGQSADNAGEGTATFIGAAYKMGKVTIKGKYMTADPKASGADTGTQTAIGLGYALGKKTTAYVYTTTQDEDLTGTDSVTKNYVGMVHKF